MNVSSVKVLLTENDILNIIKEYVDVPGLEINNINIDEYITVYGSYKKGIKIKFKGKMSIIDVQDNVLNIKLEDVYVYKLYIFKFVQKLGLSAVSKLLKKAGIEVSRDILHIDMDEICKLIGNITFKLDSVALNKGSVLVKVEKISYNSTKEPEKKEEKIVDSKENSKEKGKKVSDCYSKCRTKAIKRAPKKYKKIIDYALIIPDVAILLGRLVKDKNVKLQVKAVILIILGYLASPIDLIPDCIPVIGEIDDIAVAFFGLNYIINNVSEDIIKKNWAGKDDIIAIMKNIVKIISNVVGSNRITNIVSFVKSFIKAVKIEEGKDEASADIH